MIGATVGSYRITDHLGEGGMGAVFIAEHTLLGRKAAVKMLLPEFSLKPTIVQRFFNEARAATMVHHPGIIEVFDFGYAADGMAFIVMELLRGQVLTEFIHGRKRVPELDIIRIGRQAASALAAAHHASIVHRDLKPDNIFLVPDANVVGGERVKILDFGIAKLAADNTVDSQLTRTGTIMGSPAYMAPEQCRGASDIDSRADIYSLGCVMYEMATGCPLFEGEGIGEVLAKHIYEPPRSPRELNAAIAVAMESVICRCLEKEPSKRFQEMSELIDALDEIPQSTLMVGAPGTPGSRQSHESTILAPDTTLSAAARAGTHQTKPGRRRSAGRLLGAGVLVVGAVAAVGSMLVTRRGESKPSRSSESELATSRAAAEHKADLSGPQMVEFQILSRPPGAEVYRLLDGALVCKTPCKLRRPPSSGKLIYILRKEGFQKRRMEFDATSGESLNITLEPSAAVSTRSNTAVPSEVQAPEPAAPRNKRRGHRKHKPDVKSQTPARSDRARPPSDRESDDTIGGGFLD